MAKAVLNVKGALVLNVRELRAKSTGSVWAIRSEVAFTGGVLELNLPMDYVTKFPALKVSEELDLEALVTVDDRGSLRFTPTAVRKSS